MSRKQAGEPAAAANWRGVEGWARPRARRAVWHYWRHRHTLCGSYQWHADMGNPRTKLIAEKNPPGDRCRKCELRRTAHRGRRLWRDNPLSGGW